MAGSVLTTRAAPAALVAEDFSAVKRKLEEARRREEEAKQRADEAARQKAESERRQAEAEAQALAEQQAAEDRAFNAEMGRQLGAALGGLAGAVVQTEAVSRGDLSSFGIYPTPAPVYTPPPARTSSATSTTSAVVAAPTARPAGAQIVTGYVPPAATPAPRATPAASAPAPLPIVALPKPQLSCYVTRQEYCTVIRLVNRSGGLINNAWVDGDQAGGLKVAAPWNTLDKIHDPAPGGVAIDAFSETGVNPDQVQRVEWHVSLRGPLSPCQGYVLYLDPGGAWQPGASFSKPCVK